MGEREHARLDVQAVAKTNAVFAPKQFVDKFDKENRNMISVDQTCNLQIFSLTLILLLFKENFADKINHQSTSNASVVVFSEYTNMLVIKLNYMPQCPIAPFVASSFLCLLGIIGILLQILVDRDDQRRGTSPGTTNHKSRN